MDLAAALARGQAAAEMRMVDTCRIQRSTGEATDPNTGQITPTYALFYEGKCRVQLIDAQAREEDAGQATLLMIRLQVHVPMSVTGVDADDQVTITASRDPDLVGRVLTVRDLFHKTDATSRRIGVVERTS